MLRRAVLVAGLWLPGLFSWSAGGEAALRVVAVGDEFVAPDVGRPHVAFTDWLGEFLGQGIAGKVEVVAAAAPGRMPGEAAKAAAEAIASKPAVILVAFGGEGFLKATPDRAKSDIEALVGELKKASPSSAIVLAGPIETPAGEEAKEDERHRRTIAAARAAAAGILRALGKDKEAASIEEGVPSAPPAKPAPPAEQPEVEAGPPAELVPLLAIWEKDIQPIFLRGLRDPDPSVRREAMQNLVQEAGVTDETFPLLLELVKDSDQLVAQDAVNFIAGRSGPRPVPTPPGARTRPSGRIDESKAFPLLLKMLREAGLESVVGSRILGLLGRKPGGGAADQVLFAEDDLTFLATGLTSGQDSVRQAVANLLIAAGKAGTDKIRAEFPKLSESLQLELLGRLTERRQTPLVPEFLIELASGPNPTRVRTEARSSALGRIESAELPVEFLERCAIEEKGSLRDSAIAKLISKSPDSLDTFVRWLGSPDVELLDNARRALIHIVLYAASPEAAARAFGEIRKHFGAAEDELMMYLGSAFGLAAACEPIPIAGLLPPRAGQPPKQPFKAPSPGRSSPQDWQRWSSVVRVDRLAPLVPVFERFLEQGGERERTVASGLLLELYRNARKLEGGPSRPAPMPPRATPSLAERLEGEAWEAHERGDRALFIAKATRAVAAGSPARFSNSVAWILAHGEKEEMRDFGAAEAFARTAVELGKRTPAFLDTLAGILALQGRFDGALEIQLEALQNLGNDDNSVPYLTRALFYAVKKAYKEKPAKPPASKPSAPAAPGKAGPAAVAPGPGGGRTPSPRPPTPEEIKQLQKAMKDISPADRKKLDDALRGSGKK